MNLHRPSRVAVVIPARNEEALLDGCLRSVAAAMQQVRLWDPALVGFTSVVLDGCSDRTEDVARAHPEVQVLHSTAGMVGASRRMGVANALSRFGAEPASCWIACTDADSLVPRNWLVEQLALARRGAELVLGTVLPDRAAMADRTYDDWLQRNPQSDDHPYVHGANLGFRGDSYLRAGGFAPVSEHEDVMLAAAIRKTGGQVVSTASCAVITSSRVVGRTPGGFAAYLADLVQ